MTDKTSDKLIQGYNRMMERARDTIEQAESKAMPVLRQSIEKARHTAVELEELSHDEAQLIFINQSNYLIVIIYMHTTHISLNARGLITQR